MSTIGFRFAVLSCSIAVIAIVALAVAGIRHEGVREEMRRSLVVAGQITRLMSNPQSEHTVGIQRRARMQVTRELDQVRAAVRRINRRELLLPQAFSDPAPPPASYRFAELYRDAINGLISRLRGGGLPSASDVAAAELELTERALFEQETKVELNTAYAPRPAHAAACNAVDARRYAEITKARTIRCYVDRESFDLSPRCLSPAPPSVEEMWFAQVGLWVQQDVVTAIAALNEKAAQSRSAPACVQHMPVKRIVHMYVLGYRLADGLLPFPAPDLPRHNGRIRLPPGLTGSVCDEEFDVVLFRVIAVVDQRDVLQLIDGITRQNLCCCTGTSYAAVPPGDAAAGYTYGGEPAICVALEFEVYMAREIYDAVMPAQVRALLNVE